MSGPYTPGPWLCQTPHEDGSITIIGDNLGGLVGAAHCWPTEVETGGSDRVRANARLIAAAPELVEALRGLVDAYTDPEAGERDRRLAIEDARALLARIEGGEA